MTVRKLLASRCPVTRDYSFLVFVCLLFLGVGCAPKTVIQPVVVPPSPHTVRDASVSEILLSQFEAWKGVRHRIGGTDRQGVDCSGLVQAIFREAFQVTLPRTSRDQSRMGQRVEVKEMRPGDLVYFLDKGGDHIGVLVAQRTFLHASASRGVTLSTLDAYWWPRLKRVQRVLS
ncbi:NLP/P60 protein [Desulfomicrobium baculatum DSM 4028]|uniref:NLP/P60 protein n=1 Tax=Desulfomicrobium baculatum (strain DSM 4028 / VKM B-1378 / X) TaxID=525897 RepID=C7LVS5_DESBD|nr:NLP/P60 protein [Desulfomicrobium baculatum DSM 4028]